jgi:hypothetical protein
VEFALGVQIIESAEKLPDDNGDVLFSKHARFHL